MKRALVAAAVAALTACGTPGTGGTGGASTGGASGTGGSNGGTGGGATAAGGGEAVGGGGDATGGGEGTGGGSAGGSATGGGESAGGGTASSGGGAATGGGSSAGSCAGSGYAYCEDFESYPVTTLTNNMTLGPWKATLQGDAGMWVDSDNPAHGSRALHVIAPFGLPSRGTLNQKNLAAGLVDGGDLFGRCSVFFSSDGGLPDGPFPEPPDGGGRAGVHSWLFSTGANAYDGGTVSINMGTNGTPKMQLNYHWPCCNGKEQSFTGGTLTAGSWHCVQWQMNGSGRPAADSARVWLDGTQILDVDAGKGWDFADWNTFDFGYNHFQTLDTRVDVYLDDFALNNTMIPCAP